MDHLKRRTIKQIAGLTVATTCAATAGASSANEAAAFNAQTKQDSHANAELAAIDVYTRMSASTNDIEVVVVNSGNHTAQITQMTPSQTVTERGTFDFSRLMREGDLTLAPGQSVVVPMTPHPVVLDASSSARQRAGLLPSALRSSFSVVVDNQAFAKVHVAGNIRLV